MTTSLIVAIVGTIVYFVCGTTESSTLPKTLAALAELGRLAFLAGLLAYLMR